MELEQQRRLYAELVGNEAGLTDADRRIVNAFATVPREEFLGCGPWKVKPAIPGLPYEETPDADPRHLYKNVLVAIDPSRGLNNGLPAWLARAMHHCHPQPGDRVVHIGCGVGYYTAIFAEIVDTEGSVLGVEVDEVLATRAKENLRKYSNVTVVASDGSHLNVGESDVIFVNAGATHLQRSWLDNLRVGGRLLVPLTFAPDQVGQLLLITRHIDKWSALFVEGVYIFPCIGSRDDIHADQLRVAVEANGWSFAGEIRFDPNNADQSCWLRSDWYWLSSTKGAAERYEVAES